MSDEMVMRTTDSPAVATGEYGAANAIVDTITGAADQNEWALNNNSDDYGDTALGNEDIESEIRQRLYDNLANQEPGHVPYERFREVNAEARQGREYQERLERWSDVIQQLESRGFQSAADVQRALAEQAIEQGEQQIRSRYASLAQDDVISPDLAQAQAEADIQRMRYDRLMNQMSDYMVHQQRQQAFDQFPYARRAENIVDNLIQSGMNPLDAAQAVHEQVGGLVESIVPELTEMLSSRMRQPVPIDTSYSNQPAVQQMDVQQPRGTLSKLSQLLGIGRNNTL